MEGHRPRAGAPRCAAGLLALALAFAFPRATHAQDDSGGEEPRQSALVWFLNGRIPRSIGNQAYQMTFYELGYSFEYAPWMSPDGRTPVYLSGLAYHENRGHLSNAVIGITLAALAASSRQTSTYAGEDANYVYYRSLTASEQAAEDARVARGIQAGIDVARERPLSLGVRAYSDVLGSQVSGATVDLGAAFHVESWGSGFVITPSVVLSVLHSNGRWRPGGPGPDGMVAQDFAYEMLGGDLDLRIPIVVNLALRVKGMYGYRFTGDPVGLVQAGAEVGIGNRFNLRAMAATDLASPAPIAGIGVRAEAGVRF